MKIGNLEVINLLGKIDKENIFIGNIMECVETGYHASFEINKDGRIRIFYGRSHEEPKLYKENVILIKIMNDPVGYVILDDVNSIFKCLEIYNLIGDNDFSLGETIMSNKPLSKGDKYIDEENLKSYYKKETGKVKVKQIKQEVPLNRRMKHRIEY